MPAFVEYLNALPSVYDLFKHQEQAVDGVPILYSDKDYDVNAGPAYAFRHHSKANQFEQLELANIIGT